MVRPHDSDRADISQASAHRPRMSGDQLERWFIVEAARPKRRVRQSSELALWVGSRLLRMAWVFVAIVAVPLTIGTVLMLMARATVPPWVGQAWIALGVISLILVVVHFGFLLAAQSAISKVGR